MMIYEGDVSAGQAPPAALKVAAGNCYAEARPNHSQQVHSLGPPSRAYSGGVRLHADPGTTSDTVHQ
ncbi:hypothetical protein AMECASPLE_012734 [Ameca splendens]|uniref:Uncharacterized protein n=1 Tax=Ameca splendens TaxID=208324 RepID=A0ABV0YC92_9TELE